MHALPRMVADQPVGKQVQVLVLREGKQQTISVMLGRLEEAEKIAAAEPTETLTAPPEPAVVAGPLGLTLADLSPAMRDKFGIKAQVTGGVLVTGVAAGSTAAEKRLQPGDVIVEISQERVSTPDDVNKRIANLRKEGRKNVQMVLQNEDGNVRVVNLSLADEPAEQQPQQ
jgi:serine protease Do